MGVIKGFWILNRWLRFTSIFAKRTSVMQIGPFRCVHIGTGVQITISLIRIYSTYHMMMFCIIRWLNIHDSLRGNLTLSEDRSSQTEMKRVYVEPPHLNIKTVFPGMEIFFMKIRGSSDRLIFIMGILILVSGETASLYWDDPRVSLFWRTLITQFKTKAYFNQNGQYSLSDSIHDASSKISIVWSSRNTDSTLCKQRRHYLHNLKGNWNISWNNCVANWCAHISKADDVFETAGCPSKCRYERNCRHRIRKWM